MEVTAVTQDKTRSSTPDDLDWDDHRHEPLSLPRASPHPLVSARSRAATAATITTANPRREFSEMADEMLRAGVGTEQAVEDDPTPESGLNRDEGHSLKGQSVPARNGSVVVPPLRARDQTREGLSRRASSTSTESRMKPETSKQQQKRRKRRNTAISRAPSEREPSLHRSGSNGTHRRPTLSEVDHDSLPVEEDVCYPAPEDDLRPGTGSINFAAIMRFITEQARASSEIESDLTTPLEKVATNGSQKSHKVFHDLRTKTVGHVIDYSAETPLEVPCCLDEKLGACSSGIDHEMSGRGEQGGNPEHGDRAEKHHKPRYSFLSSRLDSPIEGDHLGDIASSEEGFRQLFNVPLEDGAHWWLDIYKATVEEIDMIAAAFYLHPLTEEDIKQQEEREKAELFKNYYFVTFRSFQIDKKRDDYMEPVQYYMVVLRGTGILSFSFHPNPHREFVQSRLLKMRDVTFLGNDWINYAIIDHIVDVYVPAIKGVEDHSDELEDNLFTARQEDLRPIYRTLGECRKRVMRLLQLTGSKHDVLAALKKRCTKEFAVAPKHELGMYLGDVRDHVLTMMANLEHAEKMITRSQTTYQAQITMAEMENNARLNKVLARITLVGTLLVPLNLVTGLFGMNVPVPGRETTGLAWFFGILSMIIASAATFLAFCRWKRWL